MPNKEKSKSILDYVKENFQTFTQLPFNKVDALVLAQFIYNDFSKLVGQNNGVSISSLYKAEEFEYLTCKTFYPKRNVNLLTALCASPRFRDITLNFFTDKYNEHIEEQFCAICFILPNGDNVISFRGTDTSLIGWKEDFNMAFLSPVPSHVSAVNYLNETAKNINGDIYLVGHSKGGNLSRYALAFCDESIKERIKFIYNFDGPGFVESILEHQNYKQTSGKAFKFVPSGSSVGGILESSNCIDIIKSNGLGFFQHNPFSWVIKDADFENCANFTNMAKHISSTFTQWFKDLNPSQIKILVDTIFSVITTSNASTVHEFAKYALKERDSVLAEFKELDPEVSQYVKDALAIFVKIYFANVFLKKE